MKLSALIEELQAIQDSMGDNKDPEVRLMTQPGWPFEFSIEKAIQRSDICEDDDDEDVCYDGNHTEEDGNIVYLLEGSQICYGTKKAWHC
jgi:hypothetical protein